MPVIVATFTASGLWHKPVGLRWVDVIVRAGGGGGGAGRGGGGGAALERRKVFTTMLGDTEPVVVGAGGNEGNDGGFSSFADLRVEGGNSGNKGGAGGYGPYRGGNGTTGRGQSVTMLPISLIAGGGGGGVNSPRSTSGLNLRNTNGGLLWPEFLGSGGGGYGTLAGEWPAGGGGNNGRGAAGVVSIIQYIEESA